MVTVGVRQEMSMKPSVEEKKLFVLRSHASHAFSTVVGICKQVLDKIGKNPICYLTGRKINLKKPETYQLDHIIPTSKGGTNDLSNLGICLKEANQAKGDLTIKQLRKLCAEILTHIPQI